MADHQLTPQLGTAALPVKILSECTKDKKELSDRSQELTQPVCTGCAVPRQGLKTPAHTHLKQVACTQLTCRWTMLWIFTAAFESLVQML
jgi:hypothetical protein